MVDILLGAALVLLVVLLVLALLRYLRSPHLELSALEARFAALEAGQERIERAVRDEIARGRSEAGAQGRDLREEVVNALTRLGDTSVKAMGQIADVQKDRLDEFSSRLARMSEANERQMETLRGTVDERLTAIQADNAAKLEQMRATVDERLQGTLEQRLGESFRSVSERLEQVHRGLGEMQALASGVGDLKKVLTNVKTRGTWGEVQLGALLEQVMAPGQYERNVATREHSSDRVEFAIKLPGRDLSGREHVWLPVDAKFPQEDYQRLLDASDRGDAEGVEQASKQLEVRIRQCARDIQEKYLDPPGTTDFGILFLPTEGLYAEVLRRPGLADTIQRDCRVVVAGPTTLWAILNSLQMGFRTLAIERRSGEVWAVLGAVKTQFGKFGELMGAVQKKLQEASNKVDQVARQSRTIERKLRDVQELPVGQQQDLLSGTHELAESSEVEET
jgi:DNA recombination protein RmuC